MTSPLKVVMRKRDQRWFIVLVALLVAIPADTHGEPIRLTSGSMLVDHTDFDITDFVASGPGTSMQLFGFWTDRLRPSRVDDFIDPSFSGVFGFHALEDEEGNLVPNLQIGDRMLSIAGTLNVSVTAPRVPIPPPVDEDPSILLRFDGLFQALFSAISSEGELFTLDISEPGGGFLFFALPPTSGPVVIMRETLAGFSSSAPIPEPSTLLLLSAAGVAAIARRRSLRSR